MIRKIIIVVLTLAAVGLWPASYAKWGLDWIRRNVPDEPHWPSSILLISLNGTGGCLTLEWAEIPNSSSEPLSESAVYRNVQNGLYLRKRDVNVWPQPYPEVTRSSTSTRLMFPFWYLTILVGAYPALAFIRGPLRRYRRRKRGLCVTCGYDLRGSSDRCPECGETT